MSTRPRILPKGMTGNEEILEQMDVWATFTDAVGKRAFTQLGVAEAFAHIKQKLPLDYGYVVKPYSLLDNTILSIFEKGVIWYREGKIGETELTQPQRTHLILALRNINSLTELESEIEEIKKIPPDHLDYAAFTRDFKVAL